MIDRPMLHSQKLELGQCGHPGECDTLISGGLDYSFSRTHSTTQNLPAFGYGGETSGKEKSG